MERKKIHPDVAYERARRKSDLEQYKFETKAWSFISALAMLIAMLIVSDYRVACANKRWADRTSGQYHVSAISEEYKISSGLKCVAVTIEAWVCGEHKEKTFEAAPGMFSIGDTVK